MAKKRKTAKKTHHRRGRIGAVPQGGMMEMGLKLAGVVIGSAGFTAIQRNLTTVNNKVVGLIGGIGGMMLVNHSEKNRSALMEGIGWGVAGGGAIAFSHDIGLIHGIENGLNGLQRGSGNYEMIDEIEEKKMAGLYEGTMVSGMSNSSHVGGLSNSSHIGGDYEMGSEILPIGL